MVVKLGSMLKEERNDAVADDDKLQGALFQIVLVGPDGVLMGSNGIK